MSIRRPSQSARSSRPPRSLARGGASRANGRPLRFRGQRAAVALVVVVALTAIAGVLGRGPGSGVEKRASKNTSGLAAAGKGGASGSNFSAVDGSVAQKTGAPATTVPPGADESSVATDAPSTATGSGPAPSGTGPGDLGPPVGPKVVRTGSIEVAVGRGKFTEAGSRLRTLATGVGGFVSASQTTSLGRDPAGTITLRVPAKSFDRVLANIAELGTVRSSSTDSQDVTGEFSDVTARIRALEAERDQIGLVLAKAQSIPDILSVRDRLSAVQGELEQLQGRQQVLDDQTTLSTITVALSEKGSKVAIPLDRPERRGLAKVWHDSLDRAGDGAKSIALGFAAMVPWLLLAALLWLPVRYLWRRLGTVPASVSTPQASAVPSTD